MVIFIIINTRKMYFKSINDKILCTFTLKFIFMVMVLIMVMIMVIAFLFIIITIVIWIMDFEVMNGCIYCYKHKQMHFKSTNDKNYLYNYT